MPDFMLDRRDLDFVLFEQFDLEALTERDPYKEVTRADFDSVLDALGKMAVEVLGKTVDDAEQGLTLKDGNVLVPDSFKRAFDALAEGGWIAVARNPELGGMGLPLPLAAVNMELGTAAATSFYFFPALSTSAGHLVEAYASEELKQLIVPRLYGGQWSGTMCLTEPQAGTSVGDLRTSAEPVDGEDYYKIKGQKIFISGGDHQMTENIVHLVLARVPGDPEGTKGISLFAVPKFRWDKDGKVGGHNDVTTVSIEEKMGIHGSPTCQLAFGENDACHGYLVGERAQGIRYMFQMMNEARIACGIQGVGAANYAYLLALAYAKDRVQGTKVTDRSANSKAVPIIEHPDVRRNLMLCKAWSEGIRALLYNTSFHAENARSATGEEQARSQDLLELLTPVCKAYGTDVGFKVTELAIQIHGGYGYLKEYAVERLMRDVKIASIYEGTNGVQALDLLGRKMRMKDGALFMTWLMDANAFLELHKDHARLGDVANAVDAAKNALGEAAMSFSAQAKEDPEVPLLGATPFLEMFGHVEVARLLLDQAIIADTKLRALMSEKGVDEGGLAEFARNNAEARFYDGKIKSARFFANAVLPHARANAKSITSGDRSALDIVF